MQLKLFFIAVLGLAASTISCHIFLNMPPIQSDYDLAKKIDGYVLSYGNFSGAILVARAGRIIINKGYGFANYEFDAPITDQTKFRIASISKVFTATAIMLLQEKNMLSVRDSLSKYIPDFPNGQSITIYHLLTHTSGIRNCNHLEIATNLEDVIACFKTWSLEFDPGSAYKYSNSGYLLLAYIIEKAAGKKYEEFLNENIFKPCDMRSSGEDNAALVLKNRAHGYIKENNYIKHVPFFPYMITLCGNGSLYSSLEDLYKFDRALDAGKIVSIYSIASMITPYIGMKGSLYRAHGYGWFIDKLFDRNVIEYSGALRGFLSKYIKFIDDKITIIILTNVEDREQFSKICDDIPAMIYN